MLSMILTIIVRISYMYTTYGCCIHIYIYIYTYLTFCLHPPTPSPNRVSDLRLAAVAPHWGRLTTGCLTIYIYIYIYIYHNILVFASEGDGMSNSPPAARFAKAQTNQTTQSIIIYMCVYIYIYICIHVYIYIYTYTYIYIYTYTYIHTYMRTYRERERYR